MRYSLTAFFRKALSLLSMLLIPEQKLNFRAMGRSFFLKTKLERYYLNYYLNTQNCC